MYCEINDTRLFFDTDGPLLKSPGTDLTERTTLLILHGGPGSDHEPLKPSFSQLKNDLHIFYLDQRNQGRSQREDFSTFTLSQLSDDVKAFCDAMGIKKPVVFGHSFGGMVAMAYAAKYPEHPGKLVLAGTFAKQDLAAMLDTFEALGGSAVREHAEKFWITPTLETLEAYKKNSAIQTSRRWPADIMERNARSVTHPELCCFFWQHEGKTFNLLPTLKNIQCPTLVIGGDSDPVAPMPCIEAIATHLPESLTSKLILADCGHFFWYDQPEEGFSAIRKFISSAST